MSQSGFREPLTVCNNFNSNMERVAWIKRFTDLNLIANEALIEVFRSDSRLYDNRWDRRESAKVQDLYYK